MLVTEAEVRSFGLPSHIEATDTWKPLAHGDFLTIVETALNAAGLQIARNDNGESLRQFTLVNKGAKMYATLPLTNRIDNESQLMIGLANSWDKTLAARIGFGSRVFVCSNGAFFAEKILGRKHTKHFLEDLPTEIAEALAQTTPYIQQQADFFGRLRSVDVDDKFANDFVVRAALDHGCITDGEIKDVVAEWRKPRFEEFAPRNAWSLHNAFTEVGKRIQQKNGNLHAERMVRLSGLFADEFAADLNLSASRKRLAEVAASN